MDVKLVSDCRSYFLSLSTLACQFLSFLLHPACFSALALLCLALFIWLPVALSYVNLVRGRTLQTIGCGAARCGGRRDCFTLRQPPALSPPWGRSSHVSAEAVGLLPCVRRSWHKEPPSGLNSELSVKWKQQNHSMVFVLFTITTHIAHPRKILRLF